MKRKLSFALFDSGETILGALIFSTFFPLYITKYIDTKIYSIVYGLSFLFSFFLALYLGKIADQQALRKKFFVIFTLLTAFSGLFLWFSYHNPVFSLIVFSFMAISHQQALVFYNSLLLDFDKKGSVSGLGVAFGYIASAFSLIFLAKLLKLPDVFLVVSFLFLLFSFPSFLFLKNPEHKGTVSLKRIIKDRRFILLILSVLSVTEVANTLIAMMGIYLKNVYQLDDQKIYLIIGISALGGVFGGIFWGKLTDLLSVKTVFPVGFILWTVFIVILPFVPVDLLLFLGFLAGISLSHLWTTSRVFIIEAFPVSEVSVRLSFLSITERVASTTGLFVWSLFLFLTENNYKLSAGLMVIFPVLGIFIYSLYRKL